MVIRAADAESGEHRPGEVDLTGARGLDDDLRDQHDSADIQHHELKAESQGEQVGWLLGRFVANARPRGRSGAFHLAVFIPQAGQGRQLTFGNDTDFGQGRLSDR